MMTFLRASILILSTALTCHCASAQMEPGSKPEQSAPVTDHGVSVNGKPLASPAAKADVKLGGKDVSISYNSPRMRGRTIMGGIVPYGQVWRTGANPATSLTTAVELKIGALRIPAGSYTLYTLPSPDGTPWMLIINKQTGQWGTEYHQDQDLGRVAMIAKPLAKPQEEMSITFENTKGKSTELHVRWETTDEWVKVEAK